MRYRPWLMFIWLFFLAALDFVACGDESPPKIQKVDDENDVDAAFKCNESLRSSSLLAATLVSKQGIKKVIEIGGVCESFCDQVPEAQFTSVSQNVGDSSNCKNISLVKEDVLDMSFSSLNITEPFALVVLNVDFNKGAVLSNVKFFKDALDAASLIILESSLTHSPKHDQLLELIAMSEASSPAKEEKINVRFTINNFKMSHREKFRHLVSFEKK